MKTGVLALCLLATAACTSGPPAVSSERQAKELRASSERVLLGMQSSQLRPACGKESRQPITAFLAVTARQTLSCRDVGFLARDAAERVQRRGGRFAVVIPSQDTALVCDFLRRERVTAPIFHAPQHVFPEEEITRRLAFVSLDAEGELATLFSGVDGRDVQRLVARWDSLSMR